MEAQEEAIRNQTTQTKLLVDGLKDMIKEIMKWTVQIFMINLWCGQDKVVLGCNFVFFVLWYISASKLEGLIVILFGFKYSLQSWSVELSAFKKAAFVFRRLVFLGN